MDDLISRQAAIDAVEQAIINHDSAIMRITNLPSAEPEPHWIPCSERLPESEEQVLIYAESVHYVLANDEEVLQDTKFDVEAFKMAIKALEQGTFKYLKKPNNNLQGWIPCSERLPECNGRYLVTNEAWGANEIEINVWKHGEWYYNTKPIAWMPLPEPYEAS